MLIDFRIVVSKRSRKEEGDDSHRSIIDNGKEIIETPKRVVVKINKSRERDDLSENAQDEEHRSDDREGDDAVAGTHDGADKRVLANLPTVGRIFSLSQPVKLLSFSAIIKTSLGPASAFHVRMNNCSLICTDELRMQ